MDWEKIILQKDKIYYFKYRYFYGIFTINNCISDNSIQINIKFTFIVYEYSIKNSIVMNKVLKEYENLSNKHYGFCFL